MLHILCARSLKILPVKMLIYCDSYFKFDMWRKIGISLCPYWKTLKDYLEVSEILVLITVIKSLCSSEANILNNIYSH